MYEELAECSNLPELLRKVGGDLDQYLRFEHPDAMCNEVTWKSTLGGALPDKGVGINQVVAEMGAHLIPNGSQIPKPGCTSFITTGATSAGVLAVLSGSVAAPQRIGLTAFGYLEELSLEWMARMFELSPEMKGVYGSGGSTANITALGAARQWAFERLGIDPAEEGVVRPCRIYASSACHHTVHRAAAVLGMGRSSVVAIPVDDSGRLCPQALRTQLESDADKGFVMVAVVANAGTTNTGAIDPLKAIGDLAREFEVWLHVDGAYGLPGILDPKVSKLYDGLSMADSVSVDPHKWLGAPVGIGATYVRDRSILSRAFKQGDADYLEGAFTKESESALSSMDSLGIPYSDFGVELSAPSRGAVVWAIIREIGKEGIRERVCRHNAMARQLADWAEQHPNLEVVQAPTLSICCFRYVSDDCADLNELNRRIHRQLVQNGNNIPSTTVIKGVLVIRPCFVGARTESKHAKALVDEVIEVGKAIEAEEATEAKGGF